MQLTSTTLLQGGKYRIEKVLGQGGFGITYLALQTGLNRKVAIKEFFMKEYCNRDAETSHVSIPSEGSKEFVARFRQKFVKEAQTIAGLNHPHIIRIHDIFEENGTAYYVMEYHDQGSLSELIKQCGSLPEVEALRYIREVADALSYIHKRKMNHLDIKPSNLLLDEEGHAILIDFGLSKCYDEAGNQTSTTPVGISHGYAPKEQYMGGVSTFSAATDIYSLGGTLYKLLTGKTPPNASEVDDEGLPPLPTHISRPTVAAIKQAMRPRRKERPQSVAAFLSLLDKEPVVVGGDDEETLINRERVTPKIDKLKDKKQSTNTSQGGLSNTFFIINSVFCGFAALVSTIDLFRMFNGLAANQYNVVASPCFLFALYMAFLYRKKKKNLDLYRMAACEIIGWFFISFNPNHPDDIYLVFMFIAAVVALLLSVKFQHK